MTGNSNNNDNPIVGLAQRVTALEVKMGNVEKSLDDMKRDIRELRKSMQKWLWFGFTTSIGVLINLILWVLFAKGIM